MKFLSDILAKANLIVDGSVVLNNPENATVNTDMFAVIDNGVVKYRTAAEVLSDIGAQPLLTNPVTGIGANGRIAFWNGTSSITGSGNLLYNDTTKELSLVTNQLLIGTPMARWENTNPNSLAFVAQKNDLGNTFGMSLTGSNYAAPYDVYNNANLVTNGSIRSLRLVTNGDMESGGNTPITMQPGGWNTFAMGQFHKDYVRLGRVATEANQVTITPTGSVGIRTYDPQAPVHLKYSGGLGAGFLVENTNATAYANYEAKNNVGEVGGFAQYASLGGNEFLQNNTGIYSTTNIIFLPNAGGTRPENSTYISFRPGGFAYGNETHKFFKNGTIISDPTEGLTLDLSAVLDVRSTTKGVLLPRLTTTQKTSIASPSVGLVVYDTTLNQFSYYDGAIWQNVSIGSPGVSTLAAIGSSPNANGATISGITLTLQPASASFGGVVTTGAQTFAGTKTFSDGIMIPNQRVLEFATTTGNVAGAFSTRVILDKTAGLETAEIQSNHQFGVALKIPTGQSIVFHEGSSYVGSPNIARFSTTEVSFTAPLGGNISGFTNISTGPSNSLIVGTNGSAATSYGIGAEKWAGSTFAMTLFAEDAGVIRVKFDGSVWAAGHSANANWTKNGLRLFGSTQGASNNLNPSSVAFAVVSSTQGAVSAPVMTTVQRAAIASPVAGLQIYNSTDNFLNYYNGTVWTSLVNTTNDQTIGGIKTFSTGIVTGTGSEAVTYAYGGINVYGTQSLYIGGSSIKSKGSTKLGWDSAAGDNADGNYGYGHGFISYGRMILRDFALGGGAILDNSAILQLDSTLRGVLFPRMTTTQRNTIATPATGLLIYNLTTLALEHYNGTTWSSISGGGGPETDPVFTASAAFGVTSTDITNWNNAYSWGDHGLAGYLTSFTETDPIFSASAASGIVGTDITNWNTAFSWGNHASAGYTLKAGTPVTNQVAVWSDATTLGGSTDLTYTNTNFKIRGAININYDSVPTDLNTTYEVGGRIVYANPYSFFTLQGTGNNSLAGGTILLSNGAGSGNLSGSRLGGITFGGAPGNPSSRIQAYATENWTGSRFGSDLRFSTVPNTTFTPVERMRIFNSGNILIQNGGTYTDSGDLLNVAGSLRASSATLGYGSTFGNGVTLGVQGATASSINLTNYNNYSGTGNYGWVGINGGQFAPTSGSGQHSALTISQTINQTGTANGQVSGIVVSPTLTALNASIFYRGLQLTIPGTNNYGIYQTGAGARNYFQGSVGVGTATPAASAAVDITSTTQGFLLPRMTSTERNAIASPATGLLIYDTTTVGFDFYDGSSWKALDPSLLTKSLGELEYFTDFISLPTATTSEGNGLVVNATGTGTGVGAVSTPASNRPGVMQLQTGSTATGRTSLYTNNNLNTFALGGGVATLITDLFAPTLSTSTERYAFLFGFYDATTMNQTDGVYFLYDEGGVSTGSTASANWQCVTVNNSSRTFTTTSVAVSNSTFQRLSIEVNAAGTSVVFKIDGTTVATHTTNIPTGTSRVLTYGYQLIKSIGTTSRTITTDFFYSKITFTTSR